MKHTNFYFHVLSFLFILSSVSGNALNLKKHQLIDQKCALVFAASGNEKGELKQLNDVLFCSFRITENTYESFQNTGNANPQFQGSGNITILLPNGYHSAYLNTFNGPRNVPVYIRHRRLLI